MIHSIQLCLKHSGRVNNRQRVTFTEGLNVVVGPNGRARVLFLKRWRIAPIAGGTTAPAHGITISTAKP